MPSSSRIDRTVDDTNAPSVTGGGVSLWARCKTELSCLLGLLEVIVLRLAIIIQTLG
jgi:hypothetical protein